MVSAVLAGYSYPDLLSDVIADKRAIENDIEVAINEREGNLTDAETTYIVSKEQAEKITIQGEAEVKSIINEAEAYARAVTTRWQLMAELFARQKKLIGMTSGEFIDYWLTAYVLLDATNPITTTIFNDSVDYYATPTPTNTPTYNINMTAFPTNVITTLNSVLNTEYFTTTQI